MSGEDSARKYVCVHNRNRDSYEVPLALAEAGMLAAFVTDFYASPSWKRLLPGFLARRYRAGISHQLSVMSIGSFLVQYIGQALRLPMHRVFPVSDRLLGNKAAKLAKVRKAGLLAYSSYLNERPDLAAGCRVIDFEYHPHSTLSMELLVEDHRQYPQVDWSFALEQDAAANDRVNLAWQHADAVICASSMTRRSLEHAGCPADRITVIPYGFDGNAKLAARRRSGPCRFLFVGQGIQRKGLHHLALAWRRAGIANAELAVVSYRIDPGIEKMLDQPGITVIGYQPREALNAMFTEADVFIMPSLIEGFGLVYLEALQAGCHVVGTANTGLPDLKLSEDACTITPAGDIDALAIVLADLTARKERDAFDPVAIQAEASKWSWRDFRHAIAEHAAALSR